MSKDWSPQGFRKVEREEFHRFLESYVGKLEHAVVTIGEPPSHGYFDRSKGEGYEGRQAFWQGYSNAVEGYWIRDAGAE